MPKICFWDPCLYRLEKGVLGLYRGLVCVSPLVPVTPWPVSAGQSIRPQRQPGRTSQRGLGRRAAGAAARCVSVQVAKAGYTEPRSSGALSAWPLMRTNRKLRLQATSETGLFLPQQGSRPDRKLTSRSPLALVAPPPPRPRPHARPCPCHGPAPRPGMLSGPGRVGRFAWPSAVAGAGSARRRHVPSLRLVPVKLRAEAARREPAGGPRRARCCRALSGRARAGGRAAAGRAPRGAPGGAGAARTFVRVESPPRGPGLSGAPAPLAPGRCLSGQLCEEPVAGGEESRVRGASCGTGETRCPPGPRPPRWALRGPVPPGARLPPPAGWRLGRGPRSGRAAGGGDGRGPGRCIAAASLAVPGSCPRGEGAGRAGTRNRSRREAGRGERRSGRSHPGGRRLLSLREWLVPGETVWFRSDVTVAGMRAPATRHWDGKHSAYVE